MSHCQIENVCCNTRTRATCIDFCNGVITERYATTDALNRKISYSMGHNLAATKISPNDDSVSW